MEIKVPIFCNTEKNPYTYNNNMKNQERLSDLYFGHPNASEDEINEAIQASVQKQTEKAMRKIFPMTR